MNFRSRKIEFSSNFYEHDNLLREDKHEQFAFSKSITMPIKQQAKVFEHPLKKDWWVKVAIGRRCRRKDHLVNFLRKYKLKTGTLLENAEEFANLIEKIPEDREISFYK